jgi:hypothetical protein
MRDCERLAGGLKTVARYQKDRLGTRESHSAPSRVWIAKSKKDKAVQMALWQSDKPIVAMKSGNGDGAKGLTEMRWDLRDTSSRLRTGDKTLTKIKSSDLQDGLQGVSLKSRVKENFTHGSVRGIKPKGG